MIQGESLQRFWDKVIRIPEHTCWEWIGHQDKDGYGRLRVNYEDLRAHRVSWELHNKKKIPPKLMVLHRCDNPSCINPDHLFIGTNTDNMQDAMAKGRGAPARLKSRTHCKFGHRFTEENTYMITPTKRRCRKCSAITAKRFRVRHER
jgi:hypothetical protein